MTGTSTRAERMAMPLARDSIRKIAEASGGCLRPVQLRRTDTVTGQVEQVMIPCGATLASICPPCAERAKSLRAIQCREGWHLEDEPDPGPPAPDETQEYWLILRAEAQVQPRPRRGQRRGHGRAGRADRRARHRDHPGRCPRHRHHQQRQRGREGEGAPVAVHPAPPGRPGPAQAQDRPADHRQGVHRAGRQVLPAVDVPHPHLRQLRQGPRRRHPRRPGHATTTSGRPGTRCTSPRWSTGSSRTCAASSATTCSTSAPSNRNDGSPRTCTWPSAARCPGPCCGR